MLTEADVAAAKVYTTIRGQFNFVIVLFRASDGQCLATLDANAITRLRTAATTTLAVQRLARAARKPLRSSAPACRDAPTRTHSRASQT